MSRAKSWKSERMRRVADTPIPPICIDAVLGMSQGRERNTENTRNYQKRLITYKRLF